MRLWGEPAIIPLAVDTIDTTALADPNNAAILDEKRKIEAWKRSAHPVDEKCLQRYDEQANTIRSSAYTTYGVPKSKDYSHEFPTLEK